MAQNIINDPAFKKLLPQMPPLSGGALTNPRDNFVTQESIQDFNRQFPSPQMPQQMTERFETIARPDAMTQTQNLLHTPIMDGVTQNAVQLPSAGIENQAATSQPSMELPPTGVPSDAILPNFGDPRLQQRESQVAERIAGLTPKELNSENAMNSAAVNMSQIRGEEAQGLFRPSDYQIGQAKTEAVARQADYEQRQVNNRINDQMEQFKWDNPNASIEDIQKQQLLLTNQEAAIEPQTPDAAQAFEQGMAERKQSLAERKYNDTVAKEAAGVPLSPSDQLAREKWEAEKAKEPAKTATERNIERLMEANPDLSYSDAVNIEQGVVSKTVNPLTGATETTNIASGESTPVTSTAPLPDSSLNLEPKEQGTSLFERGQKYTGAIESGLRGAQKIAGQFGGKVASDESVQTKKELDAFQGALVRAFQEGDRFSTGQDKVLREELDATLGAMKDPETFKNNAIALDKVMRQRHADLMENHRTLSYKDDFRSDSLSKARVLENAIRDLGVTQESEEVQGSESAALPEGINKAVTQDLWDVMTPEERAVFQTK